MLDHDLIVRDGPQDRLLLLVHGYGEPAAPMTDRLDLIDPEGRFVALVPRAPFTHKGADIWHRALMGSTPEASDQYLHSLERLGALVDAVCAAEGFDPAEAVFGGFSQGAGLAIGLTIADADRPVPAGCLAFCGFVPPIERLVVRRSRIAGARLVLLSATEDEFVPLEASRSSAALLADLGLDVSYAELEMAHTVSDESAKVAGAWFSGQPVGRALDGIGAEGFAAWIDELWTFAD